jgi:hypothetical protein
MKNTLEMLLLIFLVVFSSTAIAQDPCKDCDCTIYPVKRGCEKCCGVATGAIKHFTKSTLTISLPQEKEVTFEITKNTKIEGELEKGVFVLVEYRIKDKVAGFIQINPKS